jgi:sulfatase modifying factor 1
MSARSSFRPVAPVLVFLSIFVFIGNTAFAACPSADLTGDCFVGLEDFAVVANQWLTGDANIPEDMKYIPDGGFEMGDHFDPEGYDDELPVHAVLVDAFFMSKYEITNQQYCDYLNSAYPAQLKVVSGVVYAASDDPCDYPYCDTTTSSSYSRITWNGSSFGVVSDKEDHPMVQVSWYGSVAYCNWRSSEGGYEACYNLSTWVCDFTKKGYRLATEAEWEYAARGGNHSPYYRYPWGDSIDGSKANYWESGDPYETGDYPWTTPVGYYDGSQIPAGSDMANGYGLYDMAGNVWEWCNDWYASDYYDTSPFDNPTGPVSGSSRVLRGGGWSHNANRCRVASRYYYDPDDRGSGLGFRIVLDLN